MARALRKNWNRGLDVRPGGVYGKRNRNFLPRAPHLSHPYHPFYSDEDWAAARRQNSSVDPWKGGGDDP
jgi:hypothetical protein